MANGGVDVNPETNIRKLSRVEVVTELRSLVMSAKKGDASVIPRLKECFRENPHLWEGNGDLPRRSQAAWTKLIAGNDKFFQETIVAKVNAMKQELSPGGSPVLESLLVERVICTWLQLYYHECRAGQGEGSSLKWANFRLKQLNSACDRHLKAVTALATMRKLLKQDSSHSPGDASRTMDETSLDPAVLEENNQIDKQVAPNVPAEEHLGYEKNRITLHLEAVGDSYHDKLDC